MPSLDRIPDRLGPYRLLEPIGEGGMGVVHLARDRGGRLVAIKVLHPRGMDEPNARRRLAREVETMRRVRSPFVAEVIDADVTGDYPYIVTRYVPGRTLDTVVRSDGPLPPRALERLASGLAEALAAVHAAGVVHRDLKPGNVMLAGGNPVVIDFGIAHTRGATRLTQTGMFMGTPGYLAPEVIEGQPSSEASDVHSWGATVAFAATGRPPFGTGSFESVFFRIVQGNADLDGMPGPLVPVVLAALSKDPRARPSAAWLCAQSAALDLCSARPPAHAAAFAAPAGHAPGAPGQAASWYAAPGQAWGRDGYGADDGLVPGMAAPVAGIPRAAGPGMATPTMREAAMRPGSTRHLPEPVTAGDVAALLPPVQYAPPAPAGQPGVPAPPAGTADAGGYAELLDQGTSQRRARRRPRTRSHRLLALAVMVIAVSLSVMLPITGMLASLAVIAALRAADKTHRRLAVRRSVRGRGGAGVLGALVTVPWAVGRSLLTFVLLAPAALAIAAVVAIATIIAVRADTLPLAGAYAAGALVAFYGIGPGSGGPRREINRIFGAVARTRGSSAVTAIVVLALAAAAAFSALSQPPLYWPVVSSMLPHLPHLNNLFHLPRLNLVQLPNFNVTGTARNLIGRGLNGTPQIP